MCGIVGFTGRENALPILIKGLYSLEYRGYDSAGVAAFTKDGLRVVKARGRIANLEEKIKEEGGDMYCTCGIGHTRWATHGEPSDRNSHPHLGGKGKVAVVHNGIIENYLYLKNHLIRRGVEFVSETDTEVVAQMLEYYYQGDVLEAIRKVISKVEAATPWASSVPTARRSSSPCGKTAPSSSAWGGENYIASDVPPSSPAPGTSTA